MKKILSVALCLSIIFAASAGAFALEVDIDDYYKAVGNNGIEGRTYITVSHPETEGFLYFSGRDLNAEWEPMDAAGVSRIYFWADEYTGIGKSCISLVWEDETTEEINSEIIHVDVYDTSRPKITKTTRSGSSVKITWSGAKSKYYQLQYRVKNGTWKTAASEYDTTETGMKYTFKKLTKGKTYQFRVRPVTPTYWSGNKYGSWSASVSVKVK